MSGLVAALHQELQTLEAELAADPRYRKLAKIRELLAIYDVPKPTQLPHRNEPMAPVSTEPATKSDRVRVETRAFIERSGGVAHRQEILGHLLQLGLMGKERSPMASLAAYLSEMKEFMSAGGGRWTIRADLHIPVSPRRKIVRQHIPGSASSRVVEFAVGYLREKGARAQSTEIIDAMKAHGKGLDLKMDAVSSSLSHSALFDNVRGQGYGLVEWNNSGPVEPETPNSDELSGAPRADGVMPSSP